MHAGQVKPPADVTDFVRINHASVIQNPDAITPRRN